MNVKLLRDHRPDCRAVAQFLSGSWETPWAYIGEREYRDSIGRKTRGGKPWRRARCNDSSCSAEAVVREDYLLTLFP